MPNQSHQDQPIHRAGEPLETARAAMLMLHGRGASAQDILALVEELPRDGRTNLKFVVHFQEFPMSRRLTSSQ